MERIRRGEKQADLAKEYNVSRAAITNLKQRRQMLEMLEQNQRNMQLAQLGASNSNANHSGRDKRRKLSTEGRHVESENGDKDPGRDIEGGDSDGAHSIDSTSVKIEPRLPVPLPQRVHHRQVSPPTISRVLSTLLDASTADDVFQATAQRFIRLVLEETIGRSFAHAQNQAQTTPFAPCVSTCGSKEAAAMGREFQVLEPSAFVVSSATIDKQDDPEGVVVSVRLPREALERRPVMLFFDDIDVAGGAVNEQHNDSHRGDDPIHRCLLYVLSLVFQGVPEDQIFVVLCLCDAALAEQLQQRFPKVHVVTARFLSSTETVEDLHHYRVRLRAMIDEQSKQRDGNNQNVTLATAIVNSENEENVLWFLETCDEAGIVLPGRAVFCDRGKILGAVKKLWKDKGLLVALRFCTVHLLRNLNTMFKLRNTAFQNDVWKFQATTTAREYKSTFEYFKDTYGEGPANYLDKIGENNWTVYGNMSSFVPKHKPDEVPSYPLPPFGWRSTNFVESDNSALLAHGVRDCSPFEALKSIAEVETTRASNGDILAQQFTKRKLNLTPYARTLLEKERSSAGAYIVKRCSEDIFYVVSTKYTAKNAAEKIREVRLAKSANPSCSCPTYDQLRIACRHIIKAVGSKVRLQNLKKSAASPREKNRLIYNAFHPSYLGQTYSRTLKGKCIKLSLLDVHKPDEALKSASRSKSIGRPPKKRIASSGELPGSKGTKGRKCSVCGGHHHKDNKKCKGKQGPVVLNSTLKAHPHPLPAPLQQLETDVTPSDEEGNVDWVSDHSFEPERDIADHSDSECDTSHGEEFNPALVGEFLDEFTDDFGYEHEPRSEFTGDFDHEHEPRSECDRHSLEFLLSRT
ncbi:hypothetical protein Poli38472_010982 [Pythium oligandrum]|uniref:SWIM-type domain-containing protein n=1 Tax=Pythium oligandrum TaxID=41045 RepID=A0A8K1FIC0_PYTOL|nr:hypothetical protein Poli38472_010982 [Pythium oligandrum]|eukprot:TMW61919.1 hypothetical protein Poli38472_010982 [Pythium oligandrum]